MAKRSAEKERRSRCAKESQMRRRERFLLASQFLVSDPAQAPGASLGFWIPPLPY